MNERGLKRTIKLETDDETNSPTEKLPEHLRLLAEEYELSNVESLLLYKPGDFVTKLFDPKGSGQTQTKQGTGIG